MTLVRGMTVNNFDGSFVMHVGGEVDIRGVYCALSVARLTGVYTDDMFRGTELWVARWVLVQIKLSIGALGTPSLPPSPR